MDANGNTKARGADSFAYDQANRLLSAIVGGTTTANVYDGDGKRASQTVGANPATSYVYDVAGSLPLLLTDGGRKYVYGLGLAYAVDGAGNVQVYHADGLGSVRAITDGSGNVVQTLQTDAFGVPTQSQGSVAQPFGFTGQQADTVGLVYLRARFYDPASGRFMGRDPLSGLGTLPLSLNHYAYALNNPVAATDPSGLSSSKVLGQQDCLTDLQHNCPVPLPNCFGMGPCIATLAIPKVFCRQLSLFCEDEDGAASATQYRSGAYGKLKRSGSADIDVHHMPAKAINGLPEDLGPAIQMDRADHVKTKSFGGGRGSAPERYRQEIQLLLDAGQVQAAMDKEIEDIQTQFGSKYDDAIKEMLDYARQIGFLK